MSGTLSKSLREQITRVFVFVNRAIDHADEATWKGVDPKEKGIWQHTVHMIESLDFYMRDYALGDYEWSQELGVDWEEYGSPNTPDQQTVRDYATRVKVRILEHLEGMSDADVAVAEEKTPWVGATYLDKAIYILRHTTHHVGEINQIFLRHGLEIVKQDR